MTGTGFQINLEAWAQGKRAQARDVMEEIARDGVESVEQTIHNSTTPWGEARVAGRHGEPRASAGRIETANMLNTVDSEVRDDGNAIEVEWGWFDPELYIRVQEAGANSGPAAAIAPMHSLVVSLDEGEQRLRASLARIAGGS